MIRTIFVLEAITWNSKAHESYSVFPFVGEFAKVSGLKTFHQTFSDSKSFRHWVRIFDQSKSSKPKLLLIACHGEKKWLKGFQTKIEFSKVSLACREASNVENVHFATCGFGSERNLSMILNHCPNLKWVSGYARNVDWVESMLFDILFMARMVDIEKPFKGISFQGRVRNLLSENLTLAERLGFRFHYRHGESLKSISSLDIIDS